jgi:ABC-type polysaccharide/polyol phosphate transport system ATPase subunit
MKDDIVLQVDNLGKRFKIYQSPWARALEWISCGRKVYHQDFWALKDISFKLKKGGCLGIIGPNGAGKTTLLKILTRSLYPTTGTFQVRGNVLSLLELGTGFNQELTGRQNIYHSCFLLGFPEGYVSERIQDIQAFAELGEFFDRPIKTYSSGMYVRIAFSMFVFLKPEIFVVDEALSAGDFFFQQKCFAKMREMLSSGTTCLFASHDTAAVQNLCDRAILLNNGKIDYQGLPESAISRYFAGIHKRRMASEAFTRIEIEAVSDSQDGMLAPAEIIAHNILGEAKSRFGPRGLEIVAACAQNEKGIHTLQVKMMEPIIFHLLLRANDQNINPSAGIKLVDRFGNIVFAAGTWNLRHKFPDLFPGQELVVRFELFLTVQPGLYTFTLGCSVPASEEHGKNLGYNQDRYEMLGPLEVYFDLDEMVPFYGVAQLPMKAKSQLIDNK